MRLMAVACCILATSGAASANEWTPADVALTRIGAPTIDHAHAARFGTRSWAVRFKGDQLLVVPLTQKKPAVPFPREIDTAHLGYYGSQPTQAVKAGSDWFLAYYHGEFGGGLWQFDASGAVGKRLLDDPTYSLLRYGREVLALTQDNSMMVRSVRIHRFAKRGGTWQEIGHADFASNINELTPIGADLYVMMPEFSGTALAHVNLAGRLTVLWRHRGDLDVNSIARSKSGDFALGSIGYVVRLHRSGAGFIESWYAPRDCATYTNVLEADGSRARCFGVRGVRSYEKHSFVPIRNPLVSFDGKWMASRFSPVKLIHFTGSQWLPAPLPPLDKNEFPSAVDDNGAHVVLRTNLHIWAEEDGHWRVLTSGKGCPVATALTQYAIWGSECADVPNIWRAGFDGKESTWQPPHGAAESMAGGFFDDLWFSEKGAAFLGHLDVGNGVRELPTAAPISSVSRGGDRVWFTEADKTHYGFIDAKNTLHEFKESSQYVEALSIRGAPHGAWITHSLGARIMMYYMEGTTTGRNYIADIRLGAVTSDGSAWALSNNWLTVIHATQSGEMTRYRLPCLDAHVQFFPAPNNGIWVQSYEARCNALIDAHGLHVRDLPEIERVDYQ